MRLGGGEARAGLGRIQETETIGVGITGFRETRGEGAVRLASGFDESPRLLVRFVGGGGEPAKVSAYFRGRSGRKRQRVGRWPEHRLEGGRFLDGGGQPAE
jgi:hypothetical protein